MALSSEKTPLQSIGEKIAYWRRDRQITQRMLADALGVAHGTVGAWEASEKKPSVRNLLSLAEILGVPPGELMPEFDLPKRGRMVITDPDAIALVKAYLDLPQRHRPTLLALAQAYRDSTCR